MSADRLDADALGFDLPESASDSDVLGELLSTMDDPDSQRAELSDADLGSLEDEFDSVALLNERKKELESQLRDVSKELEAAKGRMLEAMKLQGTSQFRGGQGQGSCYVQERFDTQVEDPDAFMRWVQTEHPELLTVHAQTRNKFIREEYRDKGVDPESDGFPPGVKVTPREVLAVRGARAKKKES